MKKTLATLLLFSTAAMAAQSEATQVLLSIFPEGDYYGSSVRTEEACVVSVRNLYDRVAIVASTPSLSSRAEVFVGSNYHQFRGFRTFLASRLTTTISGERENFVRTNGVSNATQFVAVGDTIVEDRTVYKHAVECVVNL